MSINATESLIKQTDFNEDVLEFLSLLVQEAIRIDNRHENKGDFYEHRQNDERS